MLTLFSPERSGLRRVDASVDPAEPLPADAVWYDLLEPEPGEERRVEAAVGIDAPTREEMQEIEVSSRLYQEGGAVYMTATVLSKADTRYPESTAITFILAGDRLVTLRYVQTRPFSAFTTRALRPGSGCTRGEVILLGLLEAVIDRTADVLERAGNEVDEISRKVFQHPNSEPAAARDFQEVLGDIGRKGDLTSKVRESLVSIGRLLTFLSQASITGKSGKDVRGRLKTLSRDVQALTDHASFLANKINLLLDATLGMINIEQNAIIKIFSVAAVVFLPPTLIASIYGMNFHAMPELDWSFGYPFAIVLMIVSAVLPYLFFKRRGWL